MSSRDRVAYHRCSICGKEATRRIRVEIDVKVYYFDSLVCAQAFINSLEK